MLFRSPLNELVRAFSCPDKKKITERIEWEEKPSFLVKTELLAQVSYLPDSVRKTWLSLDGKIKISAPQDTESVVFTEAESSETFTTDGTLSGFTVGLLSDVSDIRDSFLHEIGHMVYDYSFGLNSGYVLPNYETEKDLYLMDEGNGNRYLTSTPQEYFAELFSYTMKNKVGKYEDTKVIEEIIEKNF